MEAEREIQPKKAIKRGLPEVSNPAKRQRISVPLQGTHKHPSPHFGEAIESGVGRKYHGFNSLVLPNREAAEQYLSSTGLTADSGVDIPNAGRARFSRRGSIGAASELDDGSFAVWRLSSVPTSEALKQEDTAEALSTYDAEAEQLTQRVTNSRGTPQTVNSVLSDFGKVVPSDGGDSPFQWQQGTFAQGVSGDGLAKRKALKLTAPQKREQYGPSWDVMGQRGLKANSSQASHSEPMAMTQHNQVREGEGLPPIDQDRNMVGIMTSGPNQVCAQCGPMLSAKGARNSVISGAPGIPFGGQKPGVVSPDSVLDKGGAKIGQATVFRASPASVLLSTQKKENTAEVSAIHGYHKP